IQPTLVRFSLTHPYFSHLLLFFFRLPPPTEIYTLSLHDALPISPMAKLSILTWLGNAFAVLLGKHGDITQQTQQAGCSRQAAYRHAERVQHAVEEAQRPGPSRDELLQENRRLKEQVAGLRRQLRQAIVLDHDKKQRLTVTT